MKLLIGLFCLSLISCASRPKGEHRQAPSVAGVKANIQEASEASKETSRQIVAVRGGTTRIDGKATRALRFF